MTSKESSFISISLEIIRIIRRVEEVYQIEEVEEKLSQEAKAINWNNHQNWKTDLDLNSKFLMKKLDNAEKSVNFKNCPILMLMNFIYSVDTERNNLSLRVNHM